MIIIFSDHKYPNVNIQPDRIVHYKSSILGIPHDYGNPHPASRRRGVRARRLCNKRRSHLTFPMGRNGDDDLADFSSVIFCSVFHKNWALGSNFIVRISIVLGSNFIGNVGYQWDLSGFTNQILCI